MAASILREISPFEFEVEVEVEVESPPPDTDPVDFVGCEVAEGVAEDANCDPMARAPAWKTAKESLLPSGPGLTANTMPWPQWLAAVLEF